MKVLTPVAPTKLNAPSTAPERHLVGGRRVQANVGGVAGIIDGIVYRAITGAIFAWRWPH